VRCPPTRGCRTAIGWSGETKISSKNVVQVNINEDHVRALLRNYECVYALVLRGARLKGDR